MYPPSITSVSPVSARTGEEITITGLRLGPTEELATVELNGVVCEINAWSNTSISCNVPHTSSGTLVVTTRTNNVVDYGATGDGGTDDTDAIQDAIDDLPSNGSILYFPAGTYIVKAPAIETDRILSLADTNIKVCGDGVGVSTIKVANACPTYQWLLGPDTAGTDLTGLEICDLTLDHNIVNNPITNEAETVAWPEYSCGTYVGSNINLHDFNVINASSRNNVVVNGATVLNVMVNGVDCSVCGDDPNHIVHDASFIYVHGSDYNVKYCDLSCASPVLPGGTTAIETHGTDYTVRNNTTVNWNGGIIVTGINIGDSTGLIIADNDISGCYIGMYIWSQQYLTHTTGFGIDGCDITNNIIDIIHYGGVGDTDKRGGIIFYPTVTLDVNDLNISGNTITVDALETVPGGFRWNSYGIGFLDTETPVHTLSNSSIIDNDITYFPACGIRLNGDLDTISITGNILTDCGSTLAAMNDPERTPIYVDGSLVTNLDISGNTFTDDIAVTRIPYCIYITADAGSSGITISGNTYDITGDKSAFIKQIEVLGDDAVPLITETITDFIPPNGKCDPASTVIDGIYTWTVDGTGLIWTKIRTGDTLLTVYPDADAESTSVDGWARRGTAGTWAQIIAGAGEIASDDAASGPVYARATVNANEFDRNYRVLLLFDCSALPPGAVIDEAALKFYVTAKGNGLTWSNTDAGLALVASAPAGNTELVAADYGTLGAIRFAPDLTYSGITVGWNTFQLNAAGLVAVVDGISKFGIRFVGDLDASAVAWVDSEDTAIYIYFADNVTDIPKLEIQYHV